jgi:TnpA family transposase
VNKEELDDTDKRESGYTREDIASHLEILSGGSVPKGDSDGQRFRAGGRCEASGQINARYGGEPGVLFYTHLSDQYAPFHTQVINATVRDAT